MISGAFQQVPLGNGASADLFLLRYADDGRLRSPATEQRLKERLAESSDVFLFSHGWNNTFDTALARYRDFIAGYISQRKEFGIPFSSDYRPVLVGVIWPSTSFLMPWEQGPKIAADPAAEGLRAREFEELMNFVTDSLSPEADSELVESVDGRTAIDSSLAGRAAKIVLEEFRADPDPDDGAPAPAVEDVLAAWALLDEGQAPAGADSEDFGTVRSAAGGEAKLAGAGSFDPRNLVRMASVWKMKARAGVVGAVGVGPLLRHVLEHSEARLHLLGHSFGARVVMSALASEEVTRRADSLLLLQPAVNRWCFAPDVAGTGRAGGYHNVLSRVEKTVLTTYSRYDDALTKYFPLAVRGGSLGEPSIAAFADPERFGALGGELGPAGLGELCTKAPAAVPDTPGYDVTATGRLIAIDGGTQLGGKPAISGHGDVSNPTTWWALHSLTGSA